MNILIITPIFPPQIGGPATYTVEISRRLMEKGHRVRVVTFADSKSQVNGLEVLPVRLNYKILGPIFRQASLFFTILSASRGMDLLYAQDPVVVGLGALRAGKLLRKPVAVKFVGDVAWENAVNRGETGKLLEDFLEHPDGGWYVKSIKNLQGFVLRSADRVITPSQYLKKILITYYNVPEDNIRVVYNSVEAYPLGKKRAKSGEPALIMVGRLVPWKRVDEVIRLVPELVQKYPRLKLMVVGSGPEEERLKMLCQEMKVEKHVVFTGRVSREDALELMAGSDLLVLNSVYEGLPHIVLDAMACRTPVVATNISGTNEVLENGKTGLLVSPGSAEELKDKIIRLLENDELRSRIIESAYQEVRERFTWERNLGLLEKEVASII